MAEKNGAIDQNIKSYDALMSPKQLLTDLPRTDTMASAMEHGRKKHKKYLGQN